MARMTCLQLQETHTRRALYFEAIKKDLMFLEHLNPPLLIPSHVK